jgi:hypothetical protein
MLQVVISTVKINVPPVVNLNLLLNLMFLLTFRNHQFSSRFVNNSNIYTARSFANS